MTEDSKWEWTWCEVCDDIRPGHHRFCCICGRQLIGYEPEKIGQDLAKRTLTEKVVENPQDLPNQQ